MLRTRGNRRCRRSTSGAGGADFRRCVVRVNRNIRHEGASAGDDDVWRSFLGADDSFLGGNTCSLLHGLKVGLHGGLLPFLRSGLVAIATTQETSVVEHVFEGGVNGPGAAFVSRTPLGFHEAVVEGEVVADGTLPPLLRAIIGESSFDVADDLSQGGSLVGGVGDGHADQGDVAVRWFAAFHGTLPGTCAGGDVELDRKRCPGGGGGGGRAHRWVCFRADGYVRVGVGIGGGTGVDGLQTL